MRVFKDIVKRSPSFEPNVFFDVGANKGNVVDEFLRLFPSATVHAFEPAKSTYDALQRKFVGRTAVNIHQLAMDLKPGVALFTNSAGSTGNKIVKDRLDQDVIEVSVVTGDDFCRRHSIELIDFLKIDTEGFDLQVVSSFVGMLSSKRIKYLQVECGTSLDNRFHVHLERFIHFLHPFEYRLFGLYDFVRVCHRTKQKLNGIWYCNAVFVAEVDDPKLRSDGQN